MAQTKIENGVIKKLVTWSTRKRDGRCRRRFHKWVVVGKAPETK